MPGPWEKYAQPEATDDGESSGPWAKYQAPAAPTGPSQTESAVRQFASGATAGFDDELIGGMDAFGRALGIKNLGSARHLNELQLANPTIDSQTLLDAYRNGRDKVRGTQTEDMDTNPATSIAANVVGSLASPVSKIAAPAKMGPLTRGGTIVQAMKTGALQGAVFGAGASNSDLTRGEVGQFATDTGMGAALGAAIPPAIEGVKSAAGAAKSAANWAGTKTLSSALGTKPEAISQYRQFADRMNAQPSMEQLKTISDDFVGKLSQDVEAKKITAEQAQDAFSSFHSDLKDAYRTAGYDARDALNSAQQTLKDAHNSRLQNLSGDVYDTIKQLKDDVKSGSGNALAVLDKSKANIDLNGVYHHIYDTIDKLRAEGTDEALAVADKLHEYKARVMGKNWADIPAAAAKKLIQGIDKITEYNPNASTFDKARNAAFKGIRGTLDDAVKSAVPEYATAMEPVAKDANLLSRVSDFGDKQSAAGLLSRLEHPTQFERKAALQELGQKYGTDLVNAAKPESLPEHKLVTAAQNKLESLRPDRVAANIEQTLAGSRQKAMLDAANAAQESAQSTLDPFKSLAPNAAGQTQAQQKLAQIAKGNIETTDMFQRLGKLTNTDFVQAMKDHQVLAAFDKSATNGSRNTVFGSVLGALTGAALGGGSLGAAGGMSAGASAGRVVDQWGPAITKKILDGMNQLSKNPKVETIAALELPVEVKKQMVTGLRNYLSESAAAGGTSGAFGKVAEGQGNSNRTPAKGTQKGLGGK